MKSSTKRILSSKTQNPKPKTCILCASKFHSYMKGFGFLNASLYLNRSSNACWHADPMVPVAGVGL